MPCPSRGSWIPKYSLPSEFVEGISISQPHVGISPHILLATIDPAETQPRERFTRSRPGRPKQDGHVSRSHSSPLLLPSCLFRMWALCFGETLPILWRSGCCGPQCPSLPLRPVAEEHIWAKIKAFELGKIFKSGLRPPSAPPLVLTPWVWTPDSEESEFLK